MFFHCACFLRTRFLLYFHYFFVQSHLSFLKKPYKMLLLCVRSYQMNGISGMGFKKQHAHISMKHETFGHSLFLFAVHLSPLQKSPRPPRLHTHNFGIDSRPSSLTSLSFRLQPWEIKGMFVFKVFFLRFKLQLWEINDMFVFFNVFLDSSYSFGK